MNSKQRQEANGLIEKYRNILSSCPGKTSRIQHEIRTGESQPVRPAPYRIPVAYVEEVRQELKKMKDLDIIESSKSPWVSPLVTVRKKDGRVRLCGDYRRLNSVTENDPYCMPRPEELLDRMSKANYISTLDMLKGYYQVPMSIED